jgi:hypothetical protein
MGHILGLKRQLRVLTRGVMGICERILIPFEEKLGKIKCGITFLRSLFNSVQCVYALVYTVLWNYVTEWEPFIADFEIDFRLEVESGVFFC